MGKHREFWVNYETKTPYGYDYAYTCWEKPLRDDAVQFHVIEYAALEELQGWKPIDRKDLPKNHEKMSYSREYMLELCKMQREEIERLERQNKRMRECLEKVNSCYWNRETDISTDDVAYFVRDCLASLDQENGSGEGG